MLILLTHQAPVMSKAKLSTLCQLAQHLLHMAKYGNKLAPSEPTPKKKHCTAVTFEASLDDADDSSTGAEMPGLEDSLSKDSDSDGKWDDAEKGDAVCMATIADKMFKSSKTGLGNVHVRSVVHMLTSWHNLCMQERCYWRQLPDKAKQSSK